MKLWKISQDKNNNYCTYDSAIVCAKTEEDAKTIPPESLSTGELTLTDNSNKHLCSSWTTTENVKVVYLGEAKKGMKKGVILASFYEG